MRVLMAIAAVLLATSAAQAQYSFEYDGRIIRIDPDRGTVSIPGVFDNTPKDNPSKKSKPARTDQGRARQQTNTDSSAPEQTAPAMPQQAPALAAAPVAPPAAASAATTNSAAPASTAPSETAAIPPASTPAPEKPLPVQPQPPSAAATPAIAPPATAAAVPPPAPPAPPKPAETVATASPPPAAGLRDPHSPIGIWLTEEKEGKVRIEPCGANLCGYSVDAKSNLNGEQVLINMKPGRDQKWSGRILDPNTGSTYDSTIALKGGDTLRVQGCAFGGMFCGGQTWTRVN